MSQGYNVDDILEEIRRKKAQQSSEDSARAHTYAEREQPERTDLPKRAARPEAERAEREQQAPKATHTRGKAREPEQVQEYPERENRHYDTPSPRGGQNEETRAPERHRARPQPLDGRFGTMSGGEQPEQPVRRGAAERGGGFDFRAPGVADEQERSARRSGSALNPSTDDFSLHFDLDQQTEETPRSAPHKAVRGFDETHEMGRMGWPQPKKQEQRLTQSQWRQSYQEQELLEQETPDDDYADTQDTPYVAKDLKKIRIGLGIRLGVTALLTLVLAYLALSVRVSLIMSCLD